MFDLTNIKYLCKKNGITIAELETLIGMGNGVIGRWPKGAKGPTIESVMKVADYFGVSIEYVCCREEKTPIPTNEDGLSEKQIELIQLIRSMSPLEVDLLLAQAKIEIARRKSQD